MYNNYPGHPAYPQAAQASHAQQQKPEMMANQQSYQQGQASSQSNPYQQQAKGKKKQNPKVQFYFSSINVDATE